jgi:DNA polymerase
MVKQDERIAALEELHQQILVCTKCLLAKGRTNAVPGEGSPNANTVKCRPPNNRTPSNEEITACHPYLEAQIALIRPKVVCLLGAAALKAVLPELKMTISQVHGQAFTKSGIIFVPLFHPAAALHQPKWKDVLRQDMLKLKALLAQVLTEDKGSSVSRR